MPIIQPGDLAAGTPGSGAAIPFGNGLDDLLKATPAQVVDAAIPLATEAAAIAGISNDGRMSPLRTRQAMDALKGNASALGITGTATNMGEFAGTLIPDGQTAKQAIQVLEAAIQVAQALLTQISTGQFAWDLPEESDDDPLPAPGSKKMYTSGGTMKIAI